jgi:acetyl-CoA C-acetyltransferase
MSVRIGERRMSQAVDPRTPILVGVGQSVERLDRPGYVGKSPADLCAEAAQAALADAQASTAQLTAAIDVIAATRQFENSTPLAKAPLGKSSNLPRSVATRLRTDPRRAILEPAGGNSSQHLVTEFAREIANGRAEVVLLVGAEAISTQRHFKGQEGAPSFDEKVEGSLEDRGYGLSGLVSRYAAEHGLTGAPELYAILENARRAALGQSLEAYRTSMGELFAPFSEVASKNPYSATDGVRTAAELAQPTEQNRPIADPYLRYVVARDQVNQGAALILTSVGAAKRLGVPESQWVYLNGHADLSELPLLDRPNLGAYPAAGAAVNEALRVAGLGLDDIAAFDFYSCFPIAVSAVQDAIGLSTVDKRPRTLTGGLPFFGGPGNNYSMHGVAEAVAYARAHRDDYVLVGANGGMLSKYSVGVYSTNAPTSAWTEDHSPQLQAKLDAVATPRVSTKPSGWGKVETYTVTHGKDGQRRGVIIGRLDRDGSRFVANVPKDDSSTLDALSRGEPFGRGIFVQATAKGNLASFDPGSSQAYARQPRPEIRDDYEFIKVEKNGRILEITINRPEARNSLHPPAHDELDHALNSFFADPDLWVAILTGAGGKAFCAGNDLIYTGQGKPMWTPVSGFGGITSRRDMTKPVICAVNGFAMGGGFEIALACHLVVADETARFALSEPKVGLIAGAGGLVRLPRCIPQKKAYELILTGRQMDASEALGLGVVNKIAPTGQALEGARELAAAILESSPTSVRMSLQLMNETLREPDVITAVDLPSTAIDDLLVSEDAWEGLAAFAQKRKPAWRNR